MTRKKPTRKATKRQTTYRDGSVLTIWERPAEGMSGGSLSPGPRSKPRRKPSKKTLQRLEKSAILIAQGKPDWPLALTWWPNVPERQARNYLRTIKSKHRQIHDDFIKKYTPST